MKYKHHVTCSRRKNRKRCFLNLKRKNSNIIKTNLSKEMQKYHKKKTLILKKNYEIKVKRGDFKGKTGKVIQIKPEQQKIFVDNIFRNKFEKTNIFVPLKPSNIQIIKI
ncbi:60S ribosomal protein L26 (nucleomorph) [Guillardia theta]|uniref:60S ribosomal protein L26 n=1 Tax=Guillardia theta TaxID=55529 RepID=Q98RW9_GUITH|nr:60S ribosomal protein L26 [Guillardia theta]AAK39831.1 60S ribosomal protein L26 [Guillardia theta]|mmetsp:Transcript_4028/g.14955  ORF Transcript_4028/g.14955 Transcript_4028/m.14955 type:complete len:109 (+) Transcript_4028:1267-1593(+)